MVGWLFDPPSYICGMVEQFNPMLLTKASFSSFSHYICASYNYIYLLQFVLLIDSGAFGKIVKSGGIGAGVCRSGHIEKDMTNR